jgi:hypothetical protein
MTVRENIDNIMSGRNGRVISNGGMNNINNITLANVGGFGVNNNSYNMQA